MAIQRDKLGRFVKGMTYQISQETKDKIGLANKGKTCWAKGKKLSKEHRDKLSKAMQGNTRGLGHKVSYEARKRISEKQRGNLSHNWKGGRFKIAGYIYIYKPDHPNCNRDGYVFEHRLVMEKHLERYLTKEEIVHHIDFNKNNNKTDNLHLFNTKNTHRTYHNFLTKIVKEMVTIG